MAEQNESRNLIDILDLHTLEQFKKDQLNAQFQGLLQGKFMVKVLEQLSDQQVTEFVKILEIEPEDVIQDFMKKHIPNYNALYESVLQEVSDELKDLSDEIDNNFSN